MEHSGFIILPRDDFDRVWQELLPTHKVVLLRCILLANYCDREWWDGREFVKIKRGQFATSYRNLAQCCGRDITVTKVRTALTNLKRMGEISTENHTRYTLVIVVNYERYANLGQYIGTEANTGNSTQNDTPVTQDPHSSNTLLTHGPPTRESIKALRQKGINEDLYGWVKQLVNRWNQDVASRYSQVPPVRLRANGPPLGKARMRHLRQRFAEADFTKNIEHILTKIHRSPGLTTRTSDWNWVITFDFLIENDSNYMKILEGKYERRGKYTDIDEPDGP